MRVLARAASGWRVVQLTPGRATPHVRPGSSPWSASTPPILRQDLFVAPADGPGPGDHLDNESHRTGQSVLAREVNVVRARCCVDGFGGVVFGPHLPSPRRHSRSYTRAHGTIGTSRRRKRSPREDHRPSPPRWPPPRHVGRSGSLVRDCHREWTDCSPRDAVAEHLGSVGTLGRTASGRGQPATPDARGGPGQRTDLGSMRGRVSAQVRLVPVGGRGISGGAWTGDHALRNLWMKSRMYVPPRRWSVSTSIFPKSVVARISARASSGSR